MLEEFYGTLNEHLIHLFPLRRGTASRRSLLVCLLVDGKEVRHFLLQRGGRLFRCIEVWATCNHDTTRREE